MGAGVSAQTVTQLLCWFVSENTPNKSKWWLSTLGRGTDREHGAMWYMADITVAHNVRLAFCDTGLWLDFPYFIKAKPVCFCIYGCTLQVTDKDLAEMVCDYVPFSTHWKERSWLQKINRGVGAVKSEFKYAPGRRGQQSVELNGKLLRSYKPSLSPWGPGTVDEWEGTNKIKYTSRKMPFKNVCKYFWACFLQGWVVSSSKQHLKVLQFSTLLESAGKAAELTTHFWCKQGHISKMPVS